MSNLNNPPVNIEDPDTIDMNSFFMVPVFIFLWTCIPLSVFFAAVVTDIMDFGTALVFSLRSAKEYGLGVLIFSVVGFFPFIQYAEI
jgi:hypothetical protein